MSIELSQLLTSETLLEQEPVLKDLLTCWDRARGDRLLPKKSDFMNEMVNFPKMLPFLVCIERRPSGGFHYIYFGSANVDQRHADPTGEDFRTKFEPSVSDLVTAWTQSMFENPICLSWKVRTKLPTGVVGETENLTVLLSDEDSKPVCLTTATRYDESFDENYDAGEFWLARMGWIFSQLILGLEFPIYHGW